MEYEPYKYEPEEKQGWKLAYIKRGWLWNRYQFSREGKTLHKLESKYPNWLAKTLTVILFPVSVLMVGVPEAWRDTYRLIWDRKTGSFTTYTGWTESD